MCGGINQQSICRSCQDSLSIIPSQQHCPRCLVAIEPKQIVCNNCYANNFAFTKIVAAYQYAFPLDRLLHGLKYNHNLAYSGVLSHLFWQRISEQLNQLPDLVIPVPLHRSKQQLRGFNQVHELLSEFHKAHSQIPILNILRNRATIAQASLNRQQRLINLQNAFSLDNLNLQGKRIVLVDDVVTTGSTINELAKQCLHLGAKHIEVWCLMRALDRD
ncbi:MAG: hypothetical protein RLZZ293_872 [Pseudomonadota bacterium]